MLENSLDNGQKKKFQWARVFALPLWVAVSFGLGNLILTGILIALRSFGVSFSGINETVLSTVLAAGIYLLSLAIVIGLPWILRKHSTSREEVGLARFPSWADLGLAPVGFVVYFLITGVVLYIVTLLVPSFDTDQVQQTGFDNLARQHEYLLAFLTLVVIAPIAEEILFRGYLYGKLRKSAPIWLAVIITSVLFGTVHGQWNVAVDVFSLSVVLCALREVTGGIWAGILVHMLKNGVAFYLLFVNPSLLPIMGG